MRQKSCAPAPSWWLSCLLLLLSCLGSGWFMYQCASLPQPARFAPDWNGTGWLQAADQNSPVAYFRHVTSLSVLPDAASITISASQIFTLYVNGIQAGTNQYDATHGIMNKAYLYDIASLLHKGTNVLAVRVVNMDQQIPALRIQLFMFPEQSRRLMSWQATGNSALVYPHLLARTTNWTSTLFPAAGWMAAQEHFSEKRFGEAWTDYNPLLYQHPHPLSWLNVGGAQDGYFIRQLDVPAVQAAWLRLASSGITDIFINGRLAFSWRNLPASYLTGGPQSTSSANITGHSKDALPLGLFNITPYLHTGANVLALHVQALADKIHIAGLDGMGAGITLDLLLTDTHDQPHWLTIDHMWRAATSSSAGWEEGTVLASWKAPVETGRTTRGQSLFVVPEDTLPVTTLLPFTLLCALSGASILLVLVPWFLFSLLCTRYSMYSPGTALRIMSLACLPALALELLLIVLTAEPSLPAAFPYSASWGGLLLLFLLGCEAGLCWRLCTSDTTLSTSTHSTPMIVSKHRLAYMLRRHWWLVTLVAIELCLSGYQLSYEPYWQDELSSYYAIQGILAHGIPLFPSGFLYEKAELYSYLLALWQLLTGPYYLRLPSVLVALASLPLLYAAGIQLFQRRTAQLATIMLTFSPQVLQWSRQLRMYELAQVLSLLVFYLLFRALQSPQRPGRIMLTILALLLCYLSHEETFILLPALVLCTLLFSPVGRHRLPIVLTQKHWWLAALTGAGVIILQLVLTRVTHPPVLGTDSSQRPMIQFTLSNIPYYLNLLFFPTTLKDPALPYLTINSLLTVAGCVLALRSSDMRERFCAVFFIAALGTVVCLFTMQAERYLYPLLPMYYLLGAHAVTTLLERQWHLLSSLISHPGRHTGIESEKKAAVLSYQQPWIIRGIITMTGVFICASIIVRPMLPVSNYNLLLSRIMGIAYRHRYPDYGRAGQYIQQHWQQGDCVIAVAPDFSVFYYVGKVDYFFSVDRALFLLERNGHIVNTALGATALLNQDDFQTVLAEHTRIWIVSDNGVYQAQAQKHFRFPPDLHLVFEGYGSAVYLRDG